MRRGALAFVACLASGACGGDEGGGGGDGGDESESESEGEVVACPVDDRIASCATVPVLAQCREHRAGDAAPDDVFAAAQEDCMLRAGMWRTGACPGESCGGCGVDAGDVCTIEWYYDPTDLMCYQVANSVTRQDCANVGGIWADPK